MCEFVSWIEYDDEVYFLDNDKLNTKEGRSLLKIEGMEQDICGHGAIVEYYPELKNKGKNKECVDFSTPDNFPKEVVTAIKEGRMSRIGVAVDVLTPEARGMYYEAEADAWKMYDEAEADAWKVYSEAIADASKVYDEAIAAAWKVYSDTKENLYHNLVVVKKNRVKAWK